MTETSDVKTVTTEEYRHKLDGWLNISLERDPPHNKVSVFVAVTSSGNNASGLDQSIGKWCYLFRDVWVVTLPISELLSLAKLDCVSSIRSN